MVDLTSGWESQIKYQQASLKDAEIQKNTAAQRIWFNSNKYDYFLFAHFFLQRKTNADKASYSTYYEEFWHPSMTIIMIFAVFCIHPAQTDPMKNILIFKNTEVSGNFKVFLVLLNKSYRVSYRDCCYSSAAVHFLLRWQPYELRSLCLYPAQLA